MAKRMNIQIPAWYHFYWQETNPGAERFYRNLSDRVVSLVLLHKISKCTWDSSLKVVSYLAMRPVRDVHHRGI
jgi:hypothetical protein